MRRFKIAAVVGARPQFIKAAAIVRAHRAAAFKKKLDIFWVHTGQHYEHRLSRIFFKELLIPTPKYNLGVGSLPQGAQTGLMMWKLEDVLLREKPQGVLLFGDTNSTLAGALAAAKLNLPVFHVEAGLRSHNFRMPEEINRILTDRLSELLFCPTPGALRELKKEGLEKKARIVGDVMADILYAYKGEPKRARQKPYYLATIHRNTNTDDPVRLEKILKALGGLGQKTVLPLHPRTRDKIKRSKRLRRLLRSLTQLHLREPASYLEMLALEKNAGGIITDSGGVQKEAYLFGVPCVTLRRETEWPETVRRGMNTLCEPDAAAILKAFKKMQGPARRKQAPLYGRGDASQKILKAVIGHLSGRGR